MKPRLAALVAALALALPPDATAADVRLVARDTMRMACPKASAVYALDPTLLDVSLVDGQIVLVGKHAGSTVVTVVFPHAVETMTVQIDPPASSIAAQTPHGARSAGYVEARYDTAVGRASASVSLTAGRPGRELRVRVQAVHQRGRAADGMPSLAIPSASVEIERESRTVTLLDKYVEGTPLTLDGSVVRGVHVEQAGMEVHAGVVSASPWQDVLLPHEGDRVVSLTRHRHSAALRWSPTLMWLPDSDAPVEGVASLQVANRDPAQRLQWQAELGWSGAPGAALDLSWREPRRQAWVQAAWRPASFATLDGARPAGGYLDAAWSESLGRRTDVSVSLAASQARLGERRPEAATVQADVRHRLGAGWSVQAGAARSRYVDAPRIELERSTATLGASYEGRAFGASAQYRRQQVDGSREVGHGGRVTLRGAHEGWRASAFLDVQQQAPTLELLLPPDSLLAQTFASLGLHAGSPEDVVRQLREHAALFAEQGVTIGALRLDPLRRQAGLDLAWQREDARRTRLGLRLLADDARGIGERRRNAFATLFASWQLFTGTDIELAYTRWSSTSAFDRSMQDGVMVALRSAISPGGLAMFARGAIAGRITHADVGAARAGATVSLAGIEVRLDGQRRTMTDAEGRFSFDTPGPGEHEVSVVLGPDAGAYFSGPSTRRLAAGDSAEFALLFAPARLSGVVVSDAGEPLADVVLRLAGTLDTTTRTDSSGRFRFASPAGKAQVSIVAESVPPGFDASGLAPLARELVTDEPQRADFTVRAQRSLRGRVDCDPCASVRVTAVEAARSVGTDADGVFLLRGLPAGQQTIVVETPRGQQRSVVDMPAAPGRVEHPGLAAPR